MSILYKFRSATTFEALALPGTAARLFDVKKAIVLAKKLDQGGSSAAIEFDLSIKDATTNEEYVDENMILPRGTRLVVQRLPAARGHGFLSRMAAGGGAAVTSTAATGSNDYYTIKAKEDDDEFVTNDSSNQNDSEEKELEALRAATDSANASSITASAAIRQRTGAARVAGQGPPPTSSQPHRARVGRPNADPELREQERLLQAQQQPKKRATGIPRTFLSLQASQNAEGNDITLLQPNAMGFEELKSRGGGQSELTAGTKRDLEYALKVTATSVPEYLQCAICEEVVKDAMMLPWDTEGRTTCEECIRDALTQNGFRCPLTGQEGVSPDDLLPNMALRKAAEKFVEGVMAKMDEIDQQQVEEEVPEEEPSDSANQDVEDKGVLVSKQALKKAKKNDPFGSDDFGGDVFAFESKEPDVEDDEPKEEKVDPAVSESKDEKSEKVPEPKEEVTETTQVKETNDTPKISPKEERKRHRGPPMGYQMGPAGGALGGPLDISPHEPPIKRPRAGSDATGSSFESRNRFGEHGRGGPFPGNGRGGFLGGRGLPPGRGDPFGGRGSPPNLRGPPPGRGDYFGGRGDFRGGRGPPPGGRGDFGRGRRGGFRGRGRR